MSETQDTAQTRAEEVLATYAVIKGFSNTYKLTPAGEIGVDTAQFIAGAPGTKTGQLVNAYRIGRARELTQQLKHEKERYQ